MYFHKMGLTPQSVADYYLGSEKDFTQPISYQSLLEVTHLLFTELSTSLKIWLSSLTFFSAVADQASSWLVRFVHPAFAYFKIGSFLLLEATLAALIIFVSTSLIRTRRRLKSSQPNNSIKRKESYAP